MISYAGWDYELKHKDNGAQVIVGLDEVGRGCWAGPLVACAYVFYTLPTPDVYVADSKKLSEKQRMALIEVLQNSGMHSIGEVSAEEIDRLGLQQAQYLAYERALTGLSSKPEVVLLDGRPWQTKDWLCESVISGDAKVASIAAASILAKIHRDTLMKTVFHAQFPNYGFDKHVGYGTKLHQEALKNHGVTSLHRKSYKPIAAYLK